MFYFMLGGVLPIGQVRERVWDAIKKFDRFRSILEGDDFVADDDAFRIEDHVRELTAEEFGAPSIAQSDMGTLRRFLEKRFSAPLDKSKPLWEFLLVPGFPGGASNDPQNSPRASTKKSGSGFFSGGSKNGKSPPQQPEQYTLLIARVHHVIVDGTAAMLILGALSDEASKGQSLLGGMTQADLDKLIAQKKAQVTGGCGPIGLCCGGFGVLCKYTIDLLRPEPSTPFRGLTSTGRSLAWASLDANSSIRAARQRGCTFNDVWMACLCYAMGEHLRDQGIDTNGMTLTAGLPVSLHSPILPPEIGNSKGNKFGFLVVQLPLDPFSAASDSMHSAEARLLAVHEVLNAAKRTPEAIVSYGLASLSGCLPSSLISSVLKGAGNARASVILSNVRGPPEELHVGGLPMKQLFGFLPCPPGVGLGVGLGTYAGKAALSVTCDTALLGEGSADRFIGRMMEEHQRYCDRRPSIELEFDE